MAIQKPTLHLVDHEFLQQYEAMHKLLEQMVYFVSDKAVERGDEIDGADLVEYYVAWCQNARSHI